jgi:hypothetical protein
MQTSSADPEREPEPSEDPDDPTAPAADGMAPLINNTGADDGDGDGADASSG